MSTELGVRLRHLHQFSTVLLEEPQPLMNTSVSLSEHFKNTKFEAFTEL